MALNDADKFAQEMVGEFFSEQNLDTSDFHEYLLENGTLVHLEQQVESDLIELLDKETWVNEDIMMEDTGEDCRGQEVAELKRII